MKTALPISFLFLLFPFVFGDAKAALKWRKKDITVAVRRDAQEAVRAKFEFKNNGRNPVTVLGITTSCGCTVANAESSTVAPGKMSEVDALFTIGNRHGRQEKKITVSTDDPENPETILTFTIDLLEAQSEIHPQLDRPH
jgi:hypothetical protein